MPFEQDKDETPVLFRVAPGREPEGMAAKVTAVFPCEPATLQGDTMTCYVHVGQHGACDFGWYYTTRAARPEEYAALQRELESAPFGYRLKIYKRRQPWMRDTFRQEVRRLNARKA